MLLKFTLKAMMRRKLACLLLVVLVCAGVFGMMLLGGVLTAQEAALEKVYDDSEILCTVSDLRGIKTDMLSISLRCIDLCRTDEKYDFCHWVERVHLKYETECEIDGVAVDYPKLIGVSYVAAAKELRPENGATIRFFEGFSEEMFQTDQALCIVPQDLLPQLTEDADGLRQVTLSYYTVNDVVPKKVQGTLRVAGVYFGGADNRMFCPFDWMQVQDPTMSADSLSFYLRDNRQLDAFYAEAAKFFLEPDIHAKVTPSDLGLIIHDELFRETIAKINENITLLKILLPVLYVISAGIGFLAGFLFMRGRTREFAVMRSLGLSRFIVASLSFFEQLLIGLLGAALGLLLCGIIAGRGNAINGLLFIVAYWIGAIISGLWITNVNTMQLLKSED